MFARKLQSAAKAVEPVYIEDTFSTYLYTGNGSTQTITNGIDLAGKGGLVWIKGRSNSASHTLTDTARGAGTGATTSKALCTDSTNGESQGGASLDYLSAFSATGFSVVQGGASSFLQGTNTNSVTYASWTFRKQAKFFDVVTYTGNGGTKTVSHSLGSTPGCIIVKRTDTTGDWPVYHRSVTTNCGFLNTTNSFASAQRFSSVTSTDFTINVSTADVNANGGTYVAYLFAHDAGGFGASGSDNVISCGSFTTDGSGNATVTLGYEPQWLLRKDTTNAGTDWHLYDSMRGLTVAGQADAVLYPNLSDAEVSSSQIGLTSTGFSITGFAVSSTYIYIAIRRGPMKTPTTGTSVYNPIARSGNSTATTVTGVGFAPDLVFEAPRTNSGGNNWIWFDRLRGGAQILSSDNTGAEVTNSAVIQSDSLSTTMDGFRIQTANPINATGNTYIYYPLRRAPGFFDVVCYTGSSATSQNVSHNLGVAAELVIVKRREAGGYNWAVWSSALPSVNLKLESADATVTPSPLWISASSSTTFTVARDGVLNNTNANGGVYVAYLFATCPGVSKVGTYTGTGNVLQIDCGFTGGARFVLIKRTDSTGDWYVWDSARGIVSGNDPYLLLNSTAAEVTTTDWVDTYSAGFELSNAGGNNANINTATYIFLAIA